MKQILSKRIDSEQKFFYAVIDKLNQRMKTRFADQKNIYLDFACFDPRRFSKFKQSLPANALNKICYLVPNVDRNRLTGELQYCTKLAPDVFNVDKRIY